MSKKQLNKRQENQVQYMVKVLAAIQEGCFDEDSNYFIDIKEFDDPDKLTDFIHVIGSVVPNQIFGKLTGRNVDNLEFNHIANKLCFQNSSKED